MDFGFSADQSAATPRVAKRNFRLPPQPSDAQGTLIIEDLF